MIAIRRSDKLAIHIEFDSKGARALLGLMQGAVSGAQDTVTIDFDRRVTSKKRSSEMTERELAVIVGKDEIAESNDALELRLEATTIDYIIRRLKECVDTNVFEPAELCELFLEGRKMANDVYCIMK